MKWRVDNGMPADSFMALGNFGQYVVIIPSKRLVIVRLGYSHLPRGDMPMMARLVADVVAAVGERGGTWTLATGQGQPPWPGCRPALMARIKRRVSTLQHLAPV